MLKLEKVSRSYLCNTCQFRYANHKLSVFTGQSFDIDFYETICSSVYCRPSNKKFGGEFHYIIVIRFSEKEKLT